MIIYFLTLHETKRHFYVIQVIIRRQLVFPAVNQVIIHRQSAVPPYNSFHIRMTVMLNNSDWIALWISMHSQQLGFKNPTRHPFFSPTVEYTPILCCTIPDSNVTFTDFIRSLSPTEHVFHIHHALHSFFHEFQNAIRKWQDDESISHLCRCYGHLCTWNPSSQQSMGRTQMTGDVRNEAVLLLVS